MALDPVYLQRGALALELRPGSAPARTALDLAGADALAALVARDLARFAPGAEQHDLAFAAALFDPVELLRPGWPAHAELGRLLASAPARGEPRVAAFAGSGLPAVLQPEAAHAGGPLRLLPWVLRDAHGGASAAGGRMPGAAGERATLAPVGEQLEATLLDTGMAPADTALALQAAFAVPVEHVRYVTAHDLAALIAMQYEHAGLGALWPLLEAALFGSDEEAWLDAPPEPKVHLQGRAARIDIGADAHVHVKRRALQLQAVLEAHGITVSRADLTL
jgi:hypothetical protein